MPLPNAFDVVVYVDVHPQNADAQMRNVAFHLAIWYVVRRLSTMLSLLRELMM
jgi:hypothetical protein